MIVVLALSPSLDVTYEVAALRRGDITRPRAVTRVAGGKALNVARVAHALGADVQAIAALGGHTGKWIHEMLQDADVDVTVVPLAGSTRTCSVVVEDGEVTSSTDLYEPATPLSAPEWRHFRDVALSIESGSSAWFVVSGSLPDGVPSEEMVALAAALRSSGARLAVDSSGAGLRALAGHADLVKVNRAEVSEYLAEEHSDVESAARAIHTLHGGDVVVTDGVRGGFASIGGIDLAFEPPRAPGRFPAGSGDAFLGGLLAGLDAGRGTLEALADARGAAERNAAVPGQGVLGPRV